MRPEERLYQFGPFRLDPAERLLLHEGQAVPLSPKAFDLLVLLTENSGHLLEKDDLMKKIWPETVVEEVRSEERRVGKEGRSGEREQKAKKHRRHGARGTLVESA